MKTHPEISANRQPNRAGDQKEREFRQRVQKTEEWLEKKYIRLFSRPMAFVVLGGAAIVAGVVAGALLYSSVGSTTFWDDCARVAAVFAILGLVLALPALSYAVKLDVRAQEIREMQREMWERVIKDASPLQSTPQRMRAESKVVTQPIGGASRSTS